MASLQASRSNTVLPRLRTNWTFAGADPTSSAGPVNEPAIARRIGLKNGQNDAMILDHDNDGTQSAEHGISATASVSQNENKDAPGGKVEERPPLPPRPALLKAASRPSTPLTSTTSRPALLSKPTTAISSVEIQTLSFPDGTRGTFSLPASRSVSESVSNTSNGENTPSRKINRNGSDFDDGASLMSFAPTTRGNGGDLASLFDEGLNAQSPAWKLLNAQSVGDNPFESVEYTDISLVDFDREFDDLEEVDAKGGNEGRSFFEVPWKINILITSHRRGLAPVESKAQALSYSFIGWQANLQQAW